MGSYSYKAERRKGEIVLTTTYPAGHSYDSLWARVASGPWSYCPRCGAREVWCEQGVGDCYVGSEYACLACGGCWTMPTADENQERAKAMRKAQEASDGR